MSFEDAIRQFTESFKLPREPQKEHPESMLPAQA